MRRVALLAVAVAGAACGPTTKVTLAPIPPQTAIVGEELAVRLRASAPAQLGFSSDLDLVARREPAVLATYAGGVGLFRWTPLGDDIGDHTLRFSAEVDGARASVSVPVTVEPGAGAIAFVEPAGEGTTLDLSRAACAEVGVLVDDALAAQVTLAPGSDWADHATLTQSGALAGTLRFCPSPAQAAATTAWPLSMVASDGASQAEKRYVIVLGTLARPTPSPSPSPACDGAGPVIVHTPHKDITTAGNLHLSATVSDAQGVASATVYWSTTAPADPPDPTQMTALPMIFVGGTSQAGSWAATLPNPVVNDPPGTAATVSYFIQAVDEDDHTAGCAAHTSVSPTSGVYSFVVTRSTAP